MPFSPWYIQTLDADRGTEVARLYPTNFSITQTVNEKQGITVTVPYSSSIDYGRWFYLRHERDDNAWFYGRVESFSDRLSTGQGRLTTFTAFCNLEKLSEIPAGLLGLFDWGYRTPSKIIELDTTVDPKIEREVTLPITWEIRAGGGTNYGSHPGIDNLMFGDDVPFTNVQITMSDAVDPSNNIISEAQFRWQYLNNDSGWEDLYRVNDPDDDDYNARGTDGTAELTQSGVFTPDSDISGSWIKSNQNNFYKFWNRIWFQRGFLYEGDNGPETVVIDNILINRRVATSTAVTKILALMSGWTSSNSDTADDVYHEFRGGESIIEVWRHLAKMTGGYFVNGSYSADVIGWHSASDSNLVAKESAPVTIADDTSLGQGTKIKLIDLASKFVPPQATRFTIYGAGFGQQKMTAKSQDIYTSGGVASGGGFEYTFTVGSNSYTYNTDTNLLVNTTAETALGRAIHRDLNIPFTSSLYASGESAECSNQLLRMAIRHSEKASRSDRKAYTVRAMNMTAPLDVGSCVRVIYDDGDFSLDEAFIITRARYSYNGTNFVATYDISDDGFFIDEASNFYQDAATETQIRAQYPQPVHVVNVEEGGSGNGSTGSNSSTPIILPDTATKRPFTGDYLPVPAWIFENEFEPTTAEFDTWLAGFDAGAGTTYQYAHAGTGTGAGSILTPSWVWESNGDGTGTLIQGETI